MAKSARLGLRAGSGAWEAREVRRPGLEGAPVSRAPLCFLRGVPTSVCRSECSDGEGGSLRSVLSGDIRHMLLGAQSVPGTGDTAVDRTGP